MMRLHPWRSRLTMGLLALAGMVSFALLIAQPVAQYAVRRGLNAVPGYENTYQLVSVGFFPPTVHLSRLSMMPTDRSLPIVYVQDAVVSVYARDLLRLRVRPRASVDHAKFIVFAPSLPTPGQLLLMRKAKAVVKKLATDTDKKLKAIPLPLLFDAVQLRESEVLVVFTQQRADDPKRPEGNAPVLWLHELEASLEGLATRDGLTTEPTKVMLTGKVARSGTLTLFVTADLLAPRGLTLAGEAALKGQQLSDLSGILQIVGLTANGTLDLEVRAGVKENVITGAVQPVLMNADFAPVTRDVLTALEAMLLDAAVGLTSDRVPDRNAIATVVSFHGRLASPDIDVWSIITALFRNAFVLGLSEALASSPEGRAAR